MNHPSKDSFLQLYRAVPTASQVWLSSIFEACKNYPQYTLLLSFIARVISGKHGADRNIESALSWCETSLALLANRKMLNQAYGDDNDYVSALQATVVLKVRWLSLSDDPRCAHKASILAQDMLATAFPAIYLKKNHSKDGVQLALMLIGLHNREGEHFKAMALATKVQEQACAHSDVLTECRASFNWAVAALLLSKQHAIEGRNDAAEAALGSSCQVLGALASNTAMQGLLCDLLPAVATYAQRLRKKDGIDFGDFANFGEQWDDDVQLVLLDLIQMHSNVDDEYLACAILRNLDGIDSSLQ